MRATQKELGQVIEGTRQYVVPLFQRAYSWKKSEWEMLWNDLVNLCESSQSRPHFIGSIVTMPTESLFGGASKYILIDGQQRLTTIFLLFAALRDRARQSEDKDLQELADEINDAFLKNRYKKGTEQYRLQPTQVDRDSFYSIIDESDRLEVNDNITQCYLFFEKKFKQNKVDLLSIKNIIYSKLLVIYVELGRDDDPYLVFESLNAKGRSLTQSDLIRNYFFMKIQGDEQEHCHERYWLPMQTSLGDNLTEYIRHFLIKDGTEVKQNEIYFIIKEIGDKQDATWYLKQLHKFSQYYCKLVDPEKESRTKVKKYMNRLNRFDVNTIYPFLLNCYDDLECKNICDEEFIEILKILENFLLRRFVCNIQTKSLSKVFMSLYLQISKEANLKSESFIERLKLTLQNRDYPKDAEFEHGLMSVKLYGSNRTEKAKLILESIELSFEHKEIVDFDNLSIEHIMPQTLNDWWKEHLGEDWEITHELLIDSLGNLTLTGYNSELSNAPYPKKVSGLEKSHLELNKYFLGVDNWRKDEIEARAKNLASLALKIWPYFGDSSKEPVEQNTPKGKKPKTLTILDREYHVKTWREVLLQTLNTIAELDAELFQDVTEKLPRFVGWDEKAFRTSGKLKNGAFAELNLSATEIYKCCIKIIEIAEISTYEWRVMTD